MLKLLGIGLTIGGAVAWKTYALAGIAGLIGVGAAPICGTAVVGGVVLAALA